MQDFCITSKMHTSLLLFCESTTCDLLDVASSSSTDFGDGACRPSSQKFGVCLLCSYYRCMMNINYEVKRFILHHSFPSCFSPTCPKAIFREKKNIYSNKFFHNFYLSESSFTCPRLRASVLVRRLLHSSLTSY